MSDWRPSSGPDAAARRAAITQRIRTYFNDRNVLEVDTPALSPHAVSDVQIESFCIEASALSRAPLYLHTSPEFHMKRLLAAGYPDTWSLCRVFRDGEAGRKHQPEFTMLEWYRLGMELEDIIADTLQVIIAALDDAAPTGAARVRDYAELVREHCDLDMHNTDCAALAAAVDADNELRNVIGDERDDWLDLVMATRIVPTFEQDRLTVVQHFPASQAALARLSPSDARVAERFEVFLGPVELANGYVELTDADEQAKRMAADNRQRARRGRTLRPLDTDLLAALQHGLPQCAGVALGLERLQMVHDRTDDIRDVITFAWTND